MKKVVQDKRSCLSITRPVAPVPSFEHDQNVSPDTTDTTGQVTEYGTEKKHMKRISNRCYLVTQKAA